MKQGFMLLELMIALLIASILSIILLAAFTQTVHFQKVVDNFCTISMDQAIAINQLERDIMGTFIPLQAQIPDKKSLSQNNVSDQTLPNKEQTEKKQKQLEKIFYATNKDNQFESLSCITNNPLTIYWSESAGKAKPKIARIMYKLVKEPEHPESYMLLRQEDSNLNIQSFKSEKGSIRAYKLIGGIKHLNAEYIFIVPEKKSDKKESEQTKKEKKVNYKTVKEWNSDELQKSDAKEKIETTEKSLIPHFVRFTLTLWDNQYRRTQEVVTTIPLLINHSKKELNSPIIKPQTQQNNPASPALSPVTNQAPRQQQVPQKITFEYFEGIPPELERIFLRG